MFFGINNKYLKCPSLYLMALSLFSLLNTPFNNRYKICITIILLIMIFIEHIIPSDMDRIILLLKYRKSHTIYLKNILNKNNFYKIFYIFHIPYILIICILLITINQYIPLIFLLLQFVLNYIEIIYIKTLLK